MGKKEKHDDREVFFFFFGWEGRAIKNNIIIFGIRNYEEPEIALICCMAAAEEKTSPIRD